MRGCGGWLEEAALEVLEQWSLQEAALEPLELSRSRPAIYRCSRPGGLLSGRFTIYKALTTFVYFSAPGFSGWGCQSSLQNKPHPLLHTWLCLPSLNLASRSKSLLRFCRCLATAYGRSGPGKVLSAPLRAGSLSWRRYSCRSVDRSSSSRQPSWGQPRKQPSARHMSLFSSNDTVFALSSGHGKCGKGSFKS